MSPLLIVALVVVAILLAAYCLMRYASAMNPLDFEKEDQ